MVSGLALWIWAIPSTAAVLPNTDGSHHGLFAARIARLGTIDPHIVAAGDLTTHGPGPDYYPFAIHVCAALISQLFGVPVNTTLTVALVLAAAIVLPLGTYLLAQRFVATSVAAVAAVFAVLFPWFPFSPMLWGGLPLIVAMAQLPAYVEVSWPQPGRRRPATLAPLVALLGYGIFEEHNSEIATAVLVVALLVAVTWREYVPRERREVIRMYGVAALLFAVAIAPDAAQLLAGAAERTSIVTGNLATNNGAVALFLGATNPVVLVFAVTGVVVALRRGMARAWLWCLALFAVLYVVSLVSSRFGRYLALPWYGSATRVSYMFSYFESIFGALGAVVVFTAIAPRIARSGALRLVAVTAATACVLVTVLEARALTAMAYRDRSPVGNAQRSGFSWLAGHVRPGQRVLNEFVDGSAWMETLDGVAPVFATNPQPFASVDPQKDWGDRWYLLEHAPDLARDSRAQAAARRWDVAYVFVGGPVFTGFHPLLSVARLRAAPGYRLVWQDGPTAIFRLPVVDVRSVGAER
jgi:hypothetical protein